MQMNTAKIAGSICACAFFGLWMVAVWGKTIVVGGARLPQGGQMLLLGGLLLVSFLAFAFASSRGELLKLFAWFVLFFGATSLSYPFWAASVLI